MPLLERHPASKKYAVSVVITLLILLAVAIPLGYNAIKQRLSTHAAATNPPCQYLTAAQPVTPAFCDPLNQPGGGEGRTGPDLNGKLWSVSRLSQASNTGQGYANVFFPSKKQECATTPTVVPDNDVRICNGHLTETVQDGGNVSRWAAYPKVPMDIAGREGIVSFDAALRDDGPHGAWAGFVYTESPVPTPSEMGPAMETYDRNMFGVLFNANACVQSGGVGIETAFKTSNYVYSEPTVTQLGCVKQSTGLSQMNHVEIHLSQQRVTVYASDAGTYGPMKEIAVIDNANLTLTRGFTWMEDGHYNACKFGVTCDNAFSWRNWSFDGPPLARDLGFSVSESMVPQGDGSVDLGWLLPRDGTALSLSVPGVNSLNLASGALLEYNFLPQNVSTMSYRLNGNSWHTVPWPYPDSDTSAWRTIAVPITLSELQAGANTIQFKSSDNGGTALANVDVILRGAGGMPPAGTPVPTTPTPTAASTPTATATPTTVPTSTPTVTPSPTGTGNVVGNTQVGPSVDVGDSHFMNGSRFTVGSVTKQTISMSVHVGNVDSAPFNQFQVAIYADSGGRPGALIAHSQTGTLAANQWNVVAISATLQAGHHYWFMFNTNARSDTLNNMNYKADSSPDMAWSTNGQPFGTWPSAFGGASTEQALFSMYVTTR